MTAFQTLIIQRYAPSTPGATSTLDFMLAAAQFLPSVSVLFLEEGLSHLIPGRSDPLYQVLGLYDLHHLYVLESDLAKFDLKSQQLVSKVSTLSRQDLANFLQNYSRILSA